MNPLDQLFKAQPTDTRVLDGALSALMGVGMGLIIGEVGRQSQEQKTLEPKAEPKAELPTQAKNPYRGAKTVADIEQVFLEQPPSRQRELALAELAQYPETMAISQLPTQTRNLLAAK